MENNFGATPPYTVGIEEEFQLVDPATGELSPIVEKVLAANGTFDSLAPELSQSCLELVSPVFEDVAGISRELPTLRRELAELVRGCGACLVSAGTHPFSNPLEQPLMPGERFAEVEQEMGWVARTQAIYGLHVHVAVPDSGAAIRAVNTLAGYTPLLLALLANSPYWRGVDTRLSSARIKIFEIFPRSGLPPAFRDWEEFERHVETFIRSGSIPDYTWCWWDVRPHPKFGTVEVRALDAQTNVSRTIALTALIQCLVAASGEQAADERPESRLYIEENKWRATRYGLDARFYDFGAEKEVPGPRNGPEPRRRVAPDLPGSRLRGRVGRHTGDSRQRYRRRATAAGVRGAGHLKRRGGLPDRGHRFYLKLEWCTGSSTRALGLSKSYTGRWNSGEGFPGKVCGCYGIPGKVFRPVSGGSKVLRRRKWASSGRGGILPTFRSKAKRSKKSGYQRGPG